MSALFIVISAIAAMLFVYTLYKRAFDLAVVAALAAGAMAFLASSQAQKALLDFLLL